MGLVTNGTHFSQMEIPKINFPKFDVNVNTVNNFAQQKGDSLPSDVQLLNKGNVKPVKGSFNKEGLM